MRSLLAAPLVLLLLLAGCAADEPGAGAPDTGDEAGATGEDTGATAGDDTGTDDGEAAAGDDGGDATGTDDGEGDTGTAGAVTVATADSELGEILVDGNGRALYLFDMDEGGESACYDECAQLWPPLLADGSPEAGGAADAGLLGTVARDDGSEQVTYGGHPLYHYAGDSSPGDVTGQGVGDVWWAVDASGSAVTGEQARQGGGSSYDY